MLVVRVNQFEGLRKRSVFRQDVQGSYGIHAALRDLLEFSSRKPSHDLPVRRVESQLIGISEKFVSHECGGVSISYHVSLQNQISRYFNVTLSSKSLLACDMPRLCPNS